MYAMIEWGLQVGSLYLRANQGPVFGNFSGGTQLLKLNAKEYYYSSQLHFVLLPDGYIESYQTKIQRKRKNHT